MTIQKLGFSALPHAKQRFCRSGRSNNELLSAYAHSPAPLAKLHQKQTLYPLEHDRNGGSLFRRTLRGQPSQQTTWTTKLGPGSSCSDKTTRGPGGAQNRLQSMFSPPKQMITPFRSRNIRGIRLNQRRYRLSCITMKSVFSEST